MGACLWPKAEDMTPWCTLPPMTKLNLIFIGLFATGCGKSTAELCESVCDDLTNFSDSCEAVDISGDCESDCISDGDAAKDAGCEDEYSDMMKCMDEVDWEAKDCSIESLIGTCLTEMYQMMDCGGSGSDTGS